MPTGTETVVLQAPTAKDNHGDPLPDAEQPAPVTVQGCITWPRTSTEEGRGEVILDGLNVFLPPGAPQPDPKGTVTARGTVWEIDGAPALWLKGGTEKGTTLVLKRRGT